MTEAVLQILLILAYLAIGLLSVTFPIYALCVTYLKQEKYASEKERKRSMEKAKDEIIKLTNEMSAEKEGTQRFLELRRKVREWQLELNKLEQRPYFLTAKGAVLVPIIFLSIALFSACIGIFYYYEVSEQGVLGGTMFSLICSSMAIIGLYRTICTIEHAALREAVEVELVSRFQETDTMTQEVKVNEEVDITIGNLTPDMDLEKAEFRIFFPPEIEVKAHSGEGIVLQPKESRFPNYNMILYSIEFAAKNIFKAVDCRILAKQVGEYKIPVILTARGIEESTGELTLKVVP